MIGNDTYKKPYLLMHFKLSITYYEQDTIKCTVQISAHNKLLFKLYRVKKKKGEQDILKLKVALSLIVGMVYIIPVGLFYL